MEVFFIMAKKGQKYEDYGDDIRQMIINENTIKGTGARSLARKYNIPRGTISNWIYNFKNEGVINKRKKGRKRETEEANYKEKYEILKKFLESLEGGEQEKK
jgi:transposase